MEIKLPKSLDYTFVPGIESSVKDILKRESLILNGSELLSIDFTGRAFLISLHRYAEKWGNALILKHFSENIKQELSSIKQTELPSKEDNSSKSIPETLGGFAFDVLADVRVMFYFFTESIYWSTLGRFEKQRLPLKGTALQLVRLGSDATGIVFTLVFLIGFTLALQSAIQLELFGAGIYLAAGVGFSMFAEIGPLLTAIILAGRSGSSITAEIASMVVAEEVKALRTMGVNPIQYLILPRFQAMSVAVPLLTFAASVVGCFAGLLVAFFYLEIAPIVFLENLQKAVSVTLILKCLFKALVFGWIITLVACQKGFSVRGGADAVGQATTSCVVFSISGIILADALFSFIFY